MEHVKLHFPEKELNCLKIQNYKEETKVVYKKEKGCNNIVTQLN